MVVRIVKLRIIGVLVKSVPKVPFSALRCNMKWRRSGHSSSFAVKPIDRRFGTGGFISSFFNEIHYATGYGGRVLFVQKVALSRRLRFKIRQI